MHFSENIYKLLDAELDIASAFIREIHGYHILQLGKSKFDFLRESSVLHKVYISPEFMESRKGSVVQGKYEELPFLPNSIDAVVINHVLEFSSAPQKILNEVYNILIPDGIAIIIGFNPFSLLGISKLFIKEAPYPWGGKFIAIAKLRHRLSSIGFYITKVETCFFRPLCTSANWFSKLLFLEGVGSMLWPRCGGIYIIVATKKVVDLLQVPEEAHKSRKVVLTGSCAKPTARVHNEKS